ncbi:MAG: hypothetical protein MI922_11665, partial [Bacteroidales bacterium]|nr:hypothetical protein [Bacteroidales bacterium]
MKSIQRISFYFLLAIPCFIFKPAKSQELLWKAGNWGFFHNQEYFNDFIEPQTMGGSRIYGQIGLKPNENQEFFAGVDYLYEFGSEPYDQTIAPIIYFHHENKLVDFYVGAFPRHKIVDMPLVLLSDTIHYYRPNIEGIYFNVRKSWGYHKAWLDWTSRQTNTRRETFSLGLTGRANFGMFYYRHDFIMYHFAGPMIRISDDHIRDNGGATVGLGIDMSNKISLDTLTLFVGYCGSYDQLRDVYDTRYNSGFISMLDVSYKFISLH